MTISEEKLKHLEFIQDIIARMNSNSFHIKGWSITIVSALLAIYASTKDSYFLLVGIFPTIIFWLLDTFYLNQERKFRGLYNDIAEITKSNKIIKPFDMRSDLYTDGKYSYWSSFFSKTILKLYLSIIISLLLFFGYFQYCIK